MLCGCLGGGHAGVLLPISGAHVNKDEEFGFKTVTLKGSKRKAVRPASFGFFHHDIEYARVPFASQRQSTGWGQGG